LEILAGSVTICNYSGGVASFLAARRAVEKFGASECILLFADTQNEDEDLYRFLREGAAFLGAKLVEVKSEFDMDSLINRMGAIPSSRMGFCTRELKQVPANNWVKDNAPDALQVFGISWDEDHRRAGLVRRLGADKVWCPLCEPPYLFSHQMMDEVRACGIEPPRLYAEGFAHNNCGGACVKAGHGAWAHLLKARPETYAKWEAREARVSAIRGKDCTILRDRSRGVTTPLPLSVFRDRVSANEVDMFDIGGCGCFLESSEAAIDYAKGEI